MLLSLGDCVYGVRHEPTEKFVWNKYLMSAFESKVHYDWVIHVIHGFIGQSSILYNACIFIWLKSFCSLLMAKCGNAELLKLLVISNFS